MTSNIWNGQIRVEVCPAAEWKDAPFTGEPRSFAEFNVVSDDFDFNAYAQEALEKNVITWSFFALAVLFFLLFLIWRFLRACCVICCCATSCDARRQKHTNILWTTKSAFLKVCVVLACLTAICLAAYSSSNLEITLSKDAWKTIDAVKEKVKSVLDNGDSVVDGLEATIGALREVVTVIETGVNVTHLQENIQCIGDFLVAMPDPATLKSSISSLDTLLTTTLATELQLFSTRLDTLSSDALSVISAPVQKLHSAESWFVDFNTEINDVNSAISSLEATYADPAAAESAARELQRAEADVRDIDAFISDLEELELALDDIASSAAVSQMTDVESSISSIDISISSAKTSLQSVETSLGGFQAAFDTASPCLADFTTRMNTISQDIIECGWAAVVTQNDSLDCRLPTEVADSGDMLEDVMDPLESFFSADSAMGEFMDSLQSMEDQMDIPDTQDLEGQLATAKTDVSAIAIDAALFKTDIDNFISALTTFQPFLNTLQTRITTYLTPPTTETNHDNLEDYARNTFLSATTPLVSAISGITTNFADTFASAGSIQSVESDLTSNLNAQLADISETSDLIDGMPDLSVMLTTLDQASTAYAALGPDPSSTLADADALLADIDDLASVELSEIISPIEEAARHAKDALADARSDSVEEIEEFENEKRDLKADHFLNNPEDIGFALLAEDVNQKIYLVTLCFYCTTIVFCLALMLFVMANCQFGIGGTLVLFLLLIISYYLVALICSTILTVENDFCANLEQIVVGENSDEKLDRLLLYYFTDEGTLRSVLLEAFELDFDEMESEARSAVGEAAVIMDDWNTQGDLHEALASIPASVDTIIDRLIALERSFEYTEMHPLYLTIKSFFCCDISSFLFTIWKDLTTTGALSLFAILLGFFALHKIDKMPRVDCCGCTCRRRYMDDILAEAEDVKLVPKKKSDSAGGASRKGTQIGTDVV